MFHVKHGVFLASANIHPYQARALFHVKHLPTLDTEKHTLPQAPLNDSKAGNFGP